MRWKRRHSGSGAMLLSLTLAIAIPWANQCRSEGVAANGEPSGVRPLRVLSQIGLRADYNETGGQRARRDALVLREQVSAGATARSFSTGFMLECRLGNDSRQTLIAAGMFSYTVARWSLTASPFYERTAPADRRWLYWGNVRRELAPRHSLSFEVYGSIDTRQLSKWLLVYSASVSSPLTVSVAIGSGVGSGPDLVTRTIVTWRFGAARRT